MEVGQTLSVEADGNSNEYYDFHSELLTDGCASIDIPKEDDTYSLGSAEIKIIAVGDPTKDDNESLVVLVTYGKTNFLFTGDMPKDEISNKLPDNFTVTLLKVAHHGAEENTDEFFLQKTQPKYAVISVGADNIYKHPKETVLSLLDQAGAKTYRTDINGTITVTSDRKNITIETEK